MRPLVIAHRGASWDEPEYTLAAFRRAIEVGADYVQSDVQAATDGELVVVHDAVQETLAELRARNAPVPTLDETLETCAGRIGIAVELKDSYRHRGHDLTARTLAALGRHRVNPDAVLVVSFEIRALDQVRRLRPDLRSVLHLGRRPDPAAATRFWGVGFEDGAARPRVIGVAQGLGLATTVYTVNDEARMRELAALGVTGIFTDRPDLLRRVLS